MKATDLLKKQHKSVKTLFEKVEETEDGRQRRQLVDEIEIGTSKAEKMVDESYEEHHVVDLVLAELPEVDPEDERFTAKMTVLSALVEHHADEEEGEMFPMAEKKLGKERLRQRGEQMEQMAGDQRRAA